MKEKITLCGDNCLECPRYNAKSNEELKKVAKLWYRVGWRNRIVSNEEINCSGCSTHKQCTYQLVECVQAHGVKKCNQCNMYPCKKLTDILHSVEKYKKICKEKCTQEEYNILAKAFFEKEMNLNK